MKYIRQTFDYNFIEYANYVIKDRAIPNLEDGLKPVQRRVLFSISKTDDGRFNKVANIVGYTMQFHPHGDSSIYGALVNIANKELFIEKQGNFGNIFTGDRAAAARYIEARLTPLAKEVLFNKDITSYVSSYDGRHKEPVTLPSKIPVLLLLGVEGIAVGMSTKILPHNFIEVLSAQIAYLKDEEFQLFPDFIQGGILDVSNYQDGNGKVKVRAKLEVASDKTILIKEVPYGITTEALVASIEKQTKSGKLRISSINDYTSSEVEVEINLARGFNAKDAVDALYAFTDCEISISPQLLCIRDENPVQMSVTAVVKYYTDRLKIYLKKELELKLQDLMNLLHFKSLARIFIEYRLYKNIEELKSYEKIISTVISSFEPYKEKLIREVTKEDSERLLQLEIKRISRFDLDKNRKEINAIVDEIKQIKKDLKRIVEFTIDYISKLLEKYGKGRERKTTISGFETVSAKEVAIENIKMCYDKKTGYIGTNVKSESSIKVSEFSHILLLYRNGTYKVIKVQEKLFIGKSVVYFNKFSENSKDKIYTVIYRDKKDRLCYIKRFKNIKYILDKEYRYYPENCKLEYFSVKRNLYFTCYLERLPRMRTFYKMFELEDYRVKGVSASGLKVSDKNILKIKVRKSEIYTEIDGENVKKDIPLDDSFVNDDEPDRMIPENPSLFEEDGNEG